MKFQYKYRTRENVELLGEIAAKDRDAAFAALKEKGIKPGKLWEAPGLANKVLGKGKRWMAIGVLGALCLVLGAVFLRTNKEVKTLTKEIAATQAEISPRHQIYGDPAVMEAFERGNFGSVLPRPGDQLLAWFAQPGRIMAPKDANVNVCTEAMASNMLAVAGENLQIGADEPREAKELKQIVNKLRLEINSYLANGNGSMHSYWRRLVERSRNESQIYERTKQELEGEKDPAVWDQKNAALRKLGLRTITMPEE